MTAALMYIAAIIFILVVQRCFIIWLNYQKAKLIEKAASDLGIERLPGESTDQLRDRIFESSGIRSR